MGNSPVFDPHRDTPVVMGCKAVDGSTAALVLLHGRGGSPEDMLALAGEIHCLGCVCLAPQASGSTWYPNSFLAPLDRNEPWLSSALSKVDGILAQLEEMGFPAHKVALLGFSQGACLALEYAARKPRRFGALVGLSGGLIGPSGTHWSTSGSLDGTPVFLGCSDVDPHIPKQRVDETAQVLEKMGGQVTRRIYPNMEHTVNLDEIEFVSEMLRQLTELPK